MSIREQRILEIELGLQRIRRMKIAFWCIFAVLLVAVPACVSKINYNPYP